MARDNNVPELTFEEIALRMNEARNNGDIFGSCIRDQDGQPGCYILIMPPSLGPHIMGCVRIWTEMQGYNTLGSFGPDHEHPNN